MSRGAKGANQAPDEDDAASLRLDKWIFCARFVRTREGAATLVRKGHARVNGQRVSRPGYFLAIGDVLTLAHAGRTCVVRITGFSARRGGAAEAARLFTPVEADATGAGKND